LWRESRRFAKRLLKTFQNKEKNIMVVNYSKRDINYEVTMLTVNSFKLIFVIFCAVVLFLAGRNASAEAPKSLVHHDIKARISPKEHLIEVQDRITLPEGFPKEFTFYLHSGLQPRTETTGVILRKEGVHVSSLAESYRVTLPKGQRTFVLKYKGLIDHPLENMKRGSILREAPSGTQQLTTGS
jgi:hypothetical protein